MRRLKNITITMKEGVARWARLQAARENSSVSRFVGDLLEERMLQDEEYDAAMERYLSVTPGIVSKGRKYPRREELYNRPSLR
ncbi:MAG TPA: CopG family transcriptional regulator [Acidobacteriota bacterium]|nr:CopG family transcriptional regulator [Acidobacteriota bacterium]